MINHYQQVGQSMLKPTTNIMYVQGEAGAKGYPVANGYTMLLMDSEEKKFFIKQTDAMGVPTMRTFKFEEVIDPPQVETKDYITKVDFEEFKEEIKALITASATPKKTKAGETDA